MSPRPPTDRQRLVAHIEEMHGGFAYDGRRGIERLRPRRSWTLAQLATWHARKHHQYVTNHYHAGPNTDAANRPPGWRTGADPVRSDP